MAQPLYFYDPVYGFLPVRQQPTQAPDVSTRLREVEERVYGNSSSTVSNSNRFNHVPVRDTQETISEKPLFIEVNNRKDALKFEIARSRLMDGEEFFFINKKDGEIYCRYFNAEIPKMLLDIYEKKKSITDISELEDDKEITEIVGITNRITAIEEQIETILKSLATKQEKRKIVKAVEDDK